MTSGFLDIPKELLHPLIVHFPIGLWIVGTVFYLLSQVSFLQWLRRPAIVCGVVGCLLGWLAQESGETAADIIANGLCNPKLLEQHAKEVETALIFFGVSWGLATVFHFAYGRFGNGRDVPSLIRLVIAFGLIMGSAYLTIGGHKGFRLVYEEGAGVRGAKRCVAR